jgi:hypothetical protein
MPAIACIPPLAMKKILELRGWKVVSEDNHNWLLEASKYDGSIKPEPLPLPKRGRVLAVDVMMDSLIKTKTDLHTYFKLRALVLGSDDATAEPDQDQPKP